ncbi:hypothetical protein L4D06_08065 [Enterovibrio makurazakiensis]|uniref:Uncharacterized protein n=1 Tax=Enterovibrio gelatinilyticus TaxID=2899819 RepID=A0ABT5QUV8_9GAMM|nr:hypothetical protein [Enterovibrio sp. ZSDZ42]MDD1791788.1 hypothetical protein [Enterovibrio sp. ZSDZ42]
MKKLAIAALVLFGLTGTAYALDTHLTHNWSMPSLSFFDCHNGGHH